MGFILLLDFLIACVDNKEGDGKMAGISKASNQKALERARSELEPLKREKMDAEKGTLPSIPLEDLFTEVPLDIDRNIPLRWWSVKSAVEYLGVSERTVRDYIAEGKVECKYKIIKGHKRVFISNRSVIELADMRKWKREQKDVEDTGNTDF